MGRAGRTLLLVLLAAAVQPAAALAVDGDGETMFSIPLQAGHGLSAKLEADDDEIELTLRKGTQFAIYMAPGVVTQKGITVKFGDFGEFDVDYHPFRTLNTREPGRHCKGDPIATTEGFFEGTLRFRGERDYFQVEAARAKGTLVLQPHWSCHYGSAEASRAHGHAADQGRATLTASSRRDGIDFGAFGSRMTGEVPFTSFVAAGREVQEGVRIYRLTFVGARPASFRFDNRRGTAFVDPPAPFAGSARFLRRPHARDRWSGSLTAPLLGLGRVHLTGPHFRARLVPDLPDDE